MAGKSQHHRRAKKPHKAAHPGSSAKDIKKIGGKGDFGVQETDLNERAYTSENTKRSDRGGAPPHSGEDESRISGVGGNLSGVGSSSGGDIDQTFEGPTGENPSEAPPDRLGAKQDNPDVPGRNAAGKPAKLVGTTVQPADDRTAGPSGADSATNPARDDDSFASEVSSDEASGRNDAGG